MTEQEIDYLKNITIDDVKNFYPSVIDEDFQMMKLIIDEYVMDRTDDFLNLTQCLIFILEETSKVLQNKL